MLIFMIKILLVLSFLVCFFFFSLRVASLANLSERLDLLSFFLRFSSSANEPQTSQISFFFSNFLCL